MASLARRSQSAAAQSNVSFATSFGTSRTTGRLAPSDPLQPLRAMADRVGKEVEKFAERVDQWYTQGAEDELASYESTLNMVDSFRDLASTTVKELKKQCEAENQGALNQSVRRRMQNMADRMDEQPNGTGENLFGRSIHPAVSSIEPTSTPDSPSIQELRQWQAELATWELLRVVIDHYHPPPGTDPIKDRIARLQEIDSSSTGSNTEVWDRFLAEDNHAKEKQIILRWLEQTARDCENDISTMTDDLKAQSNKLTDSWTTGWLDTKFKIKNGKRINVISEPLDPNVVDIRHSDKNMSLVTQLDPDAPLRQKRVLEDADEYYERATWLVCFEMLRRGEPWEKINEWCKEKNEAWRGVSMGAACEGLPAGVPNLSGPSYGFLFRRMSFYAAKGARIPYEAAVYGLLSGDLKPVEAVCRSWDDLLYAQYNSLLLSRFDNYLQDKKLSPKLLSDFSKFTFRDAVANLGPWEDSASMVIQLLKQHKAVATQSLSPMKLLQGSLIAQSVDELAVKVGTALAMLFQEDNRPFNMIIDPDSEASPSSKSPHKERVYTAETYFQTLGTDPHALRILVHLLIVLQQGLGLLHAEHVWPHWVAIENTIVTYIEFLRTSKRIQLVPLYAAQLSSDRQNHCLARILADVKNPEEQRDFVKLMDLYLIDSIGAITEAADLARKQSGYTGLNEDGDYVILDHIDRYIMLESSPKGENEILWPGHRIKKDFSGLGIEPKEEAIIESLTWYNHLDKDIERTFANLDASIMIFLLNGRVGAAEKLVTEMSLETISLSRTESLCGYAFDFTQPGAEEQDEGELARQTLSHDASESNDIPDAEEHAQLVMQMRKESSNYSDLQQIVRLIILFREWRMEEDEQIQGSLRAAKKPSKRVKDVFDNINATIEPMLDFADARDLPELWLIYKAYIPELLIGYLSILQTACYFIHRDAATKAMDLATVIADPSKDWLQQVFVETGRMRELVDTLAEVSKAMLALNDAGEAKRGGIKKRGGRGETIRIWDVNVRN